MRTESGLTLFYRGKNTLLQGQSTIRLRQLKSGLLMRKRGELLPFFTLNTVRQANTAEGQYVYDLHLSISRIQSACVAPIGPVWDEALITIPEIQIHSDDGNHASVLGSFLTNLVFTHVIAGENDWTLPDFANDNISEEHHEALVFHANSVLSNYQLCF